MNEHIPEIHTPVNTIQVTIECPEVECFGSLKCTGGVGHNQFMHKCSSCGAYRVLKKSYPYVYYEDQC
jgi:hypothetical protein